MKRFYIPRMAASFLNFESEASVRSILAVGLTFFIIDYFESYIETKESSAKKQSCYFIYKINFIKCVAGFIYSFSKLT